MHFDIVVMNIKSCSGPINLFCVYLCTLIFKYSAK